jgi:hypothetical protein
VALPTWIFLSSRSWGKLLSEGPKISITTFCNKKETPIAVMSGARRGAVRSGL